MSCEVQKVCDDLIVAVSPERRELKGVGCLLGLVSSAQFLFFEVVGTGGVGVVFGICSIGDDKYLHILIQSASCPETVPLVSVYLVESLLELDTSSFEFNMHKWETIDKYGHIISGVIVPAVFHILIYDLDKVIMDIVLVDEFEVLAFTRVSFKDLNIVILNLLCLGYNIIVLVGYALIEKVLPLTIREVVVVQFLQLSSEVGDKVSLCMDREIFIPLLPKEPDELFLQISLTLEAFGRSRHVVILRDHSVFLAFSYDIVLCHYYVSCVLLCAFSFEGQEFVSVIFVLLSSLLNLGWETCCKVVGKGVKSVKDGDNSILFFQGRDGDV